jgi:quercetin dioxygenase-like cupin family protein
MLFRVNFLIMSTRKQFIGQSGAGFLSLFLPSLSAVTADGQPFAGMVVNDPDGEAVLLRDGTSVVRIKIAKSQGAESICFLSESFRPGDALPIHKHMNEDELIFIHKGSGLFTLGEKEYSVTEGAVILVPKGIWHGFQNNGSINIEMRMAYTPSGFEGFFREVRTPMGQPFVAKTMEERRSVALKWGMIYKS